jgi:hypothetical protein
LGLTLSVYRARVPWLSDWKRFRYEFGERADVDADGVPTQRKRFYQRGASANMVVQNKVARLRNVSIAARTNDGLKRAGYL